MKKGNVVGKQSGHRVPNLSSVNSIMVSSASYLNPESSASMSEADHASSDFEKNGPFPYDVLLN